MAEILKRQYDLVVLKLSIDLQGSERRHAGVRCEIEAKIAGELKTLARCDPAPEDFGIPSRFDVRQTRDRGHEFKLPAELLEMLRTTLEETGEANLVGRPLWLHLVPPYGYLGIVPWERLLVPEFGIPVLRLPDFIVPPPAEVQKTLNVVLCCSMPSAKSSFDIVDQLPRMVDRIREAAPRQQVAVHVFADADFYGTLRSAFSGRGLLDAEVALYPPDSAYPVPAPSACIIEPCGQLVNPWLLWMRDSLKGRSIDVVHFLCHGYFANERGAIAFSQSPTRNEDPRIARFVGTGELDTFVTQLGAWSCVFSSPRGNFSDMGLRMLADTLAQLRPFSILYHDTEIDADGQVLGDLYRFLYSTEPFPTPISPAFFAYCQPYRVDWVKPMEFESPVTTSINVEDYCDETGDVPNWLAAGERFVEQQRLDLRRAMQVNPGSISHDTLDTVNSTLERMQEILVRSAQRRKGGSP